MNDDPKLVYSSHCADVAIDDLPFEVQIFRAEHEVEWLLEVVDREGTSHVWDDLFVDDKEAFDAALSTIEQEGAYNFMQNGSNVVPLKPKASPRG